MFGSGIRHMAGAVAGFLGLLCAAPVAGAAPDPSGQLFFSAYRQILEYYIDPVSLETLAVAGMAGLDSTDHQFAVQEIDHSVAFFDHGRETSRIASPRPDDAQGWATVTSAAIVAARNHSPELADASEEAVYQRIFDGITSRLDRFTRYAGRDQAKDQRAARDGFGGIGVTLDYTEATPRISSLVPGGPSAHAGIEVDDRILAIDGMAITALNQRDVVERLRGPIDSRVGLSIMRPQRARPISFSITRSLIVQPSVTAEQADGVAVFHIDAFNVKTSNELEDEIRKAQNQMGDGLKGVVLDLRDNPGGLLDQAADVASLFIDHGDIASTRGRHATAAQFFAATTGDQLHGIPIVVLVNGGSASASEIVAAALQDNGRAVVVGSSSYGKGTVQMVLRLENSGELTLTWARLITPSGYILHEHGVIPTFCTDHTVDPLAQPQDLASQVQQVVGSGLHPLSSATTQPRATLTETAWAQLRGACPADTRHSALDLAVAERVLQDQNLYRQALSLAPITVAHVGRAGPSPLH